MQRKIIIDTPEYREWTGGIIVLHKLGDILQKLGYNVWFSPMNDVWRTPYDIPITSRAFANDIVVYPESRQGNPLAARNIVTYYLSRARPRGGFQLFYSEKWAKICNAEEPWNILFIIDSKHEIFIDRGEKRDGDCFTCRKNRNPNFIHRNGAIEIPRGTRNEKLVDIFNSCERFICYDFNSFLSTQAAMCGCDSIVAPQEGGSMELLNSGYPSGAMGISYGLEGVEKARKERKFLHEFYRKYEDRQDTLVDEMFKKILKYFGG